MAVDEVPLNATVESSIVSVRMLARETGLFIETNVLFENFRQYSDRDRGNGTIFTCSGFSVAIIWVKNAFFLFDFHSQNVYEFHDPSGHAILLKFKQLPNYLNNYFKSFYENSTSISSLTQYDLQLINVEIMEDIKMRI